MENEVRFLYLDDIIPNRFQPRENFDEQALKELAVSIKEHGVIQPIVVRQIGDKYEIIAGERRYKASTMAGLTKIPAIIKNLDDKESSKVALIENLQRKDLTPIEEARTYQKILELDALTQEELARTMGKSQSAVSNKLRLLALTDEVQDALLHEQISERHARSLLNVTDKQKQIELLNKVISSRMTVRELDQTIKQMNGETVEENNVGVEMLFDEKKESTDSMIKYPSENSDVSNESDPTSVDINRIRNESKDINDNQIQHSDINSLLNTTENSSELISQNSNPTELIKTDLDNEEDIIGGSGLLAGMSVDTSLIKPNNANVLKEEHKLDISGSLYQNFDTHSEENAKKESNDDFEIKLEDNTVNNVESTIKNVKKALEGITINNKNIETEEFDFDDFYQIVIRIDKK